MKILFIRHSQTILDRDKPNNVWILSDGGIKLAKQLAKVSEIKNCSRIYSSFQTKALETALIVAKPNYIPIVPIETLTETTSVTNKFVENFEEEIRNWHVGGYQIGDGETKEQSLERFNKSIESIIEENQNSQQIGIVTHGNILASFLGLYSEQGSYQIHKILKMPDLIKFDTETKQIEFLLPE